MPDADFYPEPQAKPKHPAGMYAGKYVDIIAEYTGRLLGGDFGHQCDIVENCRDVVDQGKQAGSGHRRSDSGKGGDVPRLTGDCQSTRAGERARHAPPRPT